MAFVLSIRGVLDMVQLSFGHWVFLPDFGKWLNVDTGEVTEKPGQESPRPKGTAGHIPKDTS